MFTCEKLSATLSKETCAQRHVSGKFMACSSCEVGAAHAGKPLPNPFAGVCQRCLTTGAKIVGGRLCISCYNREREAVKGKNRNGNKPTLKLGYITVLVNGEPLTDLTTGFQEMLVKVAKLGKPAVIERAELNAGLSIKIQQP